MLDLKGLAPFLSRALGFTIPLLLALHWPIIACHVNEAVILVVLRAALMGASLLLLLLWIGTGLSRAEVKWAAALGSFLVVYLASALCGTDIPRGLQDWARVATAMVAGFCTARGLRHAPTAKAFGFSFVFASLISCGLVLFVYWHYMGFRSPNYESLRVFKESALRGSGVALNPLASAAFLFCLMGMCLLRPSWLLRSIAVFVLVVVGGLTGSRAPVALLFGCGALLVLIKAARRGSMPARFAAWSSFALGVIVISVALSRATPYKISDVTEGRYDVWTVGWAKFVERPLLGHGPDSWRDDLFARLPGYYKETGALQKLKAGGYHSEYVTLLAEGGMLCFVSAISFLGLLLFDSFRIAFHRQAKQLRGDVLAFTCLFLCVRALIEIPGLFGYGQDVTDYLAYMFVALVASRISLIEQNGREVLANTSLSTPAYKASSLQPAAI